MLNKFLTFVIIIVRLALNLGSGCNFQVSIGFMDNIIEEVTGSEYKYGFVTNVETDTIGKGLNEEVIRQEGGTGLDAGISVESLPALVDDEDAPLGSTGYS